MRGLQQSLQAAGGGRSPSVCLIPLLLTLQLSGFPSVALAGGQALPAILRKALWVPGSQGNKLKTDANSFSGKPLCLAGSEVGER